MACSLEMVAPEASTQNLQEARPGIFIFRQLQPQSLQTGDLMQQTVFLTILEAGRSKVKMLEDVSVCEGPLPGSQTLSSCSILVPHGGRGKVLIGLLEGH